MAYTEIDFPTKKALKQALAEHRIVRAYQPGPFGPDVLNGEVSLEGPHYPKPHMWYARATVQDGIVIAVK